MKKSLPTIFTTTKPFLNNQRHITYNWVHSKDIKLLLIQVKNFVIWCGNLTKMYHLPFRPRRSSCYTWIRIIIPQILLCKTKRLISVYLKIQNTFREHIWFTFRIWILHVYFTMLSQLSRSHGVKYDDGHAY